MDQAPRSGTVNKPNLEWMYTPSALVNREDYLLGRTVDKSLKLLDEAEKGNTFNYADEVEKDLTPLSIFASHGSGPIDVIKKIKEDPLYQIQKKEEESLKQLLKNPVRMKELEDRVKEQGRQAKEKNSKKSKKEKKKRRRRHSSDNSSSSVSDSDDDDNTLSSKAFRDIDKLLSAKLQSLKGNSTSSKKIRRNSRSFESDSDSDHEIHRHRRGDVQSQRDSGQRDRHRDETRRHENPHRGNEERRSTNYNKCSSGATSTSSSSRPRYEERKPISNSMREEELEKKRREMMDNAKWRDEQRTNSVNRYRTEQIREKEEVEERRDPDFIRKQLITAAESGSIEKRIKSNSYNIQRSKSSMDQNFVRR